MKSVDPSKVEENFRQSITELSEQHRPSRHPFFTRLAHYPTEALRSPELLGELYDRYQAAMHATRVMGYFIPHLDTIELRVKKLQVLADDDGIAGGDTHHFQLRRTWITMSGEAPLTADDEFGELSKLVRRLDPTTASFVALVQEIYPRSLGPWVMVEGLAHDWIGALLDGLSPHFEGIGETDYFTQNFSNCLELKHAQEALDVTLSVLSRRPELLAPTIDGAKQMAEGLDILWSGLEHLLLEKRFTST